MNQAMGALIKLWLRRTLVLLVLQSPVFTFRQVEVTCCCTQHKTFDNIIGKVQQTIFLLIHTVILLPIKKRVWI